MKTIDNLDEQLVAFVESLAQTGVPPNARNQYAFDCEENDIRRGNLLIYLHEMAEREPSTLLVGEAPGYKGCRLTGVPFTSERIILSGAPAAGLFGAEKGYRVTGRESICRKEQTASIVWDVLGEVGLVPLAWNSYPFHPFKEGNERTNRPLTAAEMKLGERFLKWLLEIFEIRSVVAVGRKAEVALARTGIEVYKVRHPSHGGKAAFHEGMWHFPRSGPQSGS